LSLLLCHYNAKLFKKYSEVPEIVIYLVKFNIVNFPINVCFVYVSEKLNLKCCNYKKSHLKCQMALKKCQ
jgi:hypothetical protein